MKMDNTLGMRIWNYVSKPFQITKVLEILYMLDWVWYASISFLPDKYVTGTVFTVFRKVLEAYQISALMSIIAILHIIGLFSNIVWLRKINLLFNISVLLYIIVMALQSDPLSAGLGYLVVLVSVSIFAFWRMDETH